MHSFDPSSRRQPSSQYTHLPLIGAVSLHVVAMCLTLLSQYPVSHEHFFSLMHLKTGHFHLKPTGSPRANPLTCSAASPHDVELNSQEDSISSCTAQCAGVIQSFSLITHGLSTRNSFCEKVMTLSFCEQSSSASSTTPRTKVAKSAPSKCSCSFDNSHV